jgi:fimbrial chaperone protein
MIKLAAMCLAASAAALIALTPAAAASLEVGPIRVQMVGAERTTTITLRNAGTEPITVQIRAVDWSQGEGGDVYAPSTTLVASPPLASLAPGESQVVRLVVENLAAASTERTYRLILDELPSGTAASGAGVDTALRVLLPIFVTPSLQSRPRLSWSAARVGDSVRVTARNEGDARERLVNVEASAGGAAIAAAPEGYVLSGAARSWTLAAPRGATSVRIAGEGEYGSIEVEVPIA